MGERNLGVRRGDSAGTGEIMQADCRERREAGVGLAGELRSASMKDKRGNGHNVKGKPGQGGTPEAMGQRVARRGGSMWSDSREANWDGTQKRSAGFSNMAIGGPGRRRSSEVRLTAEAGRAG